jgi:3-oxoadipate enol-lactonase
VPTANLVGMSMGGSVAVTFAGLFPSRTLSLVLADTTAWYGPEAIPTWNERAGNARSLPRVDQVPFQVSRWFSEPFAARRPDEVNRVVRIFLATDGAAHAAAAQAMGALDARKLLPAVSASTLVLVGEQDYATPPAMARELAAGIPESALLVLPGLRHLSLVERPGLAELIRRQVHGLPIPGELPEPAGCTCPSPASQEAR